MNLVPMWNTGISGTNSLRVRHSGLYRRVARGGREKYVTDVSRQTKASQELLQSLGSLVETVPAIADKAQNANLLAFDVT